MCEIDVKGRIEKMNDRDEVSDVRVTREIGQILLKLSQGCIVSRASLVHM